MAKKPARRSKNRANHGALDLKALELAVVVLDLGSVRLAAQRAQKTAPSVSRRIRSLEEMLGVSLFERRSVGMRPTRAGLLFLEAARRVLADLETAIGRAREAGTGKAGRLVVGSHFSASTGRFRDVVIRFSQEHPDVELSLVEGSRAELIMAVRQGRADLALLVALGEEAGLDHRPLWREAALLALPEQHRLAAVEMVLWRDLADETFLVTGLGLGPDSQSLIRSRISNARGVAFHEHNISREGMFSLIGAGLGITVLAESGSGPRYPGVVFRPVGDERGPTTYEVSGYWDAKRDNPPLRRFLSMLTASQRGGSALPDSA